MELDHDASYRALQSRDIRFDGKLFIAVKTTGIYCRPICPARIPLQKNITFFETAAAAEESGFRACLRCRPESAPDTGAWRGASATVSRALRLIEDGALDTGSVDDLADRLGVGERHLRRLFKQHLGASPVGVAQTRRVLLAKQLLHQTRLSMAEVAMGAGFSSIRRFNEVFQMLYQRAPGELRRGSAAVVPGSEGVSLLLPLRAPYDWAGILSFLAYRAVPGMERVEADTYGRSFQLGSAAGWFKVGPASATNLRLTVVTNNLAVLPSVIARVRRLCDLTADPDSINAHLSKDPDLANLIRINPGLRVPGAWDGFELAIRAILGQQITVGAAIKLLTRLTLEHGTLLPPELRVEGMELVFPTADALSNADLSGLPMPRARSRSLESLAAAIVQDPALLDVRGDLESVVSDLKRLPGIGEWTAQYIAIRQLRETDAFPAADVGLLRALLKPDGSRPSPGELLERSESWRPWRAYAAQHLWNSTPLPAIKTKGQTHAA